MNFPKARYVPARQRLQAVRDYLESGSSLRSIGRKYRVSHKTLLYWVTKFKKDGAHAFWRKRPSANRMDERITEKIMLMKEHAPGLTLRQARKNLNDAGINVSIKGIWSVWRKYGLIFGYGNDPFRIAATATEENRRVIEHAERLVQEKDLKGAAQLINELPHAPEIKWLNEIPERLLGPRGLVNFLWSIRGDVSWSELIRKSRRLRKKLEKNGLLLTSIKILYLEVVALETAKRPEEKLEILKILSDRLKTIKLRSLKFLLFRQEAAAYATLMRTGEAREKIKKCRMLAYALNSALYWEALGNIYTNVGDYKRAFACFKKGHDLITDPEIRSVFALNMALYGYVMSGRYRECRKILSRIKPLRETGMYGALYNFCHAHLSYGMGDLDNARLHLMESLERSGKDARLNFIYAASSGLASLAMALNDRKTADVYLKKYQPLIKKYKLIFEEYTLKCFQGKLDEFPEQASAMPNFQLQKLLTRALRTLRTGDYQKAYVHARRHDLLGLFHRWIVFFPEIVLRMLEKGRATHLPRAILNYPVFNQRMPVIHVRFLGEVLISKNQKRLDVVLTPREQALLIQAALRSGSPGTYIEALDLFQNFWAGSGQPSRQLSHLLVKLRKKLGLTSSMLVLSRKYAIQRLINQGIFFSTDWTEFETLLTQVKSLEKTGERRYVRQEYCRAFKLVRGAPFRKMYDRWSDELRRVIIIRLENAVFDFKHACRESRIMRSEQAILQRVTGIT